jgi:hypothetical protein
MGPEEKFFKKMLTQISKPGSFHRGPDAFSKSDFLLPKIPRPLMSQNALYSPSGTVVKTSLCIDVSQKVSQPG